jgi:site-specific DNA recombinase
MTERVALYVWVSTEEQARGFSLRQQQEALREHARREGWKVVEEVEDAGYSGAYLERPGLDRVRDLVEAGGADVALAQDADRITRDPGHRAFLDEEFEKRGARLVALDDWGDDSHEGELLRYLKGWVSKGERLKTAERTRRGRLRKAREGKVVGDGKPNYGFRLNEARDGYEVDEGEACLVRRVFAMLASGSAVNEVVRALRREGFPSTSGGPASSWSHSQIRNVVFSEVYRPHDREELEALCEEGLVARGVLADLDPGARYGVWWFNTRRHARERTRERRADGSYKEAVRREAKDRREWLAVPVPDAGVPAADVRRARERLAGRSRPSRAAGRFWELAGGGVLRCGECGGGLRARSVRRPKTGKTDFYYTCNAAFRRDGRCAHATVYPAGAVEREVVVLVDDLLSDPERVTRELDEAIAREELNHRDPGGAAEFWASRLASWRGRGPRTRRCSGRTP